MIMVIVGTNMNILKNQSESSSGILGSSAESSSSLDNGLQT